MATATWSWSITVRAYPLPTSTFRRFSFRPEKVATGTVIGTSGCTGYCFGPHLHFELRVAGRAIDPIPVLCAAAARAGQPFWRSSEMASIG
jgi:hypothetical protein